MAALCSRAGPCRTIAANPHMSEGPIVSAAMSSRGLDQSLVRGVAWTGVARGVTQLVSWATTVIVARLLTPEDYGIVGMAGVTLEFVFLLSEFGIGTAIVQGRDLTREQIARLGGFALL